DVDAQDLAEQVAQGLRVGAVGIIAGRYVEIAVRPEADPYGIVIGRTRQIVEIEDRGPAARVRDIEVAGDLISLDHIVRGWRRHRAIDVEEAVGGEVRIERK